MGWLRNLFTSVVQFFAWLSNWCVLLWNLLARALQNVFGRTVVIISGIIGMMYAICHVWTTVIQPVRAWFMDGAAAGFSSGNWPLSSLVSDWVGVVNYVFPLDEALQLAATLFFLLAGIASVLAFIRLVKTIIGGWI